jgi:hypothetical protein
MSTARMGGSGFWIPKHVLRIVPSPPIVISMSGRIFPNGVAKADSLMLPASSGSNNTARFLALR